MPLSVGFIGAGNMGRSHMRCAQTLGLNLAAVTDILPAAAEQASRQFGIRRTYTDYRAMLKAGKDLDAVIIATPNKFHAEHAIGCLKAGKHVFLEKPMTTSTRDADKILAAHKASGKLLQMGMVNRFTAAVQTTRRFIAEGCCGKIYSGQAFWYRRRGIPGFGGWFTTKEFSGGGGLIDLGVHMLDVALYLMDFPKPVAVSGMTYNVWKSLDTYTYTDMWGQPTPGGKKDVDDYALGLIRFADGQTLQLNISWALNLGDLALERGVRLMGDKGGVALTGMEETRIFGEQAGHLVDTIPQFAKNDPNLDEIRHFVECVQEGRPPMPTAEQGRTVQLLLEALYRSSQEGREIRLR